MSSIPPGLTPSASSWTLDTLKVVLESEIQSLAGVTTSRFASGDTRAIEAQEAIKVGLANAQRALDAAAVLAKDAVGEAKMAHAAEHAAQAMALTLSTLELKERLKEMNNFRLQLDQERTDFVTRDRLAGEIKTIEATILSGLTTMNSQYSVLDTKQQDLAKIVNGIQSRIVAYGTAFGVAVVVFELIMRYVVN